MYKSVVECSEYAPFPIRRLTWLHYRRIDRADTSNRFSHTPPIDGECGWMRCECHGYSHDRRRDDEDA